MGLNSLNNIIFIKIDSFPAYSLAFGRNYSDLKKLPALKYGFITNILFSKRLDVWFLNSDSSSPTKVIAKNRQKIC